MIRSVRSRKEVNAVKRTLSPWILSMVWLLACGGGGEPSGSTSSGTGGGSVSSSSSGGGASSSNGSSSSGAGASGGGPACAPGADHQGFATYYDADGSGNCSFDPTGDLMVAAMNHVEYAASAVCGACVRLTGPKGEATVKIVDQCPGCNEGDLDLSQQAFSTIADLPQGKVGITWHYVPCEVTGPIVYHFKEGSNPFWTAIQIRNARYAVSKVEGKKGGVYVALDRADYNYFILSGGLGDGPYELRVTDVNGAALEDTGVPFIEAGDSPGAGQFPLCAP